MPPSLLDPGQIIKGAYDDATATIRTSSVPASATVSRVVINTASAGANTLVAGVAGQVVNIIGMHLMVDGAVNITFKDTDATALSGAMTMAVAGNGFVLPPASAAWYVTAVGKGFGITLSGAVQVSGILLYTQG